MRVAFARTRDWAVAVALALLLPAGTTCAAPAGRAGEQWQKFAPRYGGFSVLMPGVPVYQQNVTNSVSGPVVHHSFKVIRGKVPDGFTVTYHDLSVGVSPKRAEMVLDMVESGRTRTGGPRRQSKHIKLGRFPGREVTIMRSDISAGVMKNRIYLVGNRVYQVMVVTTKKDAAAPKVAKFLDSFTLVRN